MRRLMFMMLSVVAVGLFGCATGDDAAAVGADDWMHGRERHAVTETPPIPGHPRVGMVRMWDVALRANSVVLVLDLSGSMVPTQAALVRETKRAIHRLSPVQSFAVVVYYGEDGQIETSSFRSQLVKATHENRRLACEWLDTQRSRGETNPGEALRYALGLDPDVVVLVSDGNFEDRAARALQSDVRESGVSLRVFVLDEAVIESMAPMPRETAGVRRLKRIAEASGGETKIVTNRDLNQ